MRNVKPRELSQSFPFSCWFIHINTVAFDLHFTGYPNPTLVGEMTRGSFIEPVFGHLDGLKAHCLEKLCTCNYFCTV